MRILIVDDDGLNRDILGRMLKRLGHSAESAENGQRALEILLTGEFDLMLLDCNMPGMDGYETAKRIRSIESTRSMPIIALTGGDESEKLYSSGMNDYLGKPISIEELKLFLDKWSPGKA
jgi:two-component system, sensor histidine kinase SagS